MNADVRDTIENITKAWSIKIVPKTAYWYASENVS